MFPAETFKLMKRLLTLQVAKPRQKVETISNYYELFTYGDIQVTLLIHSVKMC